MGNILWLKDVKREHINDIGEKAYRLGELSQNFFSPVGFVLTKDVFDAYFDGNNLHNKINSLLMNSDISYEELKIISEQIKNLIIKAKFPKDIAGELFEAYENMNVNPQLYKQIGRKALDIIRVGRELPYAVIRVSPNLKELNNGLKRKIIFNVKGNQSLIDNIKLAYASLFDIDAIIQRKKSNTPNNNVNVSLVIQKQLQPKKSGIIITNNEGDKSQALVKVGYGLGNVLYKNGEVLDYYVIDKYSRDLKDVKVNEQEYMYGLDINLCQIKRRRVENDEKNARKLNDFEINKIMQILNDLEDYYQRDLEAEFGVEGSNIFLVNIQDVKGEIEEIEENEIVVEEREGIIENKEVPGFSDGLDRFGKRVFVLDLDEINLERDNEEYIERIFGEIESIKGDEVWIKIKDLDKDKLKMQLKAIFGVSKEPKKEESE